MRQVHVIFFGRGGTLGNFEVFAQSLATQLRAEGKQVEVHRTERRSEFFRYLESPPFLRAGKIASLHVFTHSIGAGLYLGTATQFSTSVGSWRCSVHVRRGCVSTSLKC